MVKSSKSPPVSSDISVELTKHLKLVNYFSDLDTFTDSATESMNRPMIVPTNVPSSTTVIDKKNGVYYVYLHANEVSVKWWTTNINSFTRWVMSLAPTDVVHINQTGNIELLPQILQALVVLDTLCLARKVFVVDHIIETPLFLLVCNDFLIEDFGAIYFTSGIREEVTKGERTILPYIRQLFSRAVTRGLITEAESISVINDNAIVFKTARELRQTTSL